MAVPGALTAKQTRSIKFAAERLFTVASWRDGLPRAPRITADLSRHIEIERGRHMWLSDVGLEHLRKIVGALHESDYFLAKAAYSDIWTACSKTIAELLRKKLMPETAEEFLQLVQKVVNTEIDTWTYVAPVFGVQLKDLTTVDLGSFKLIHPSKTLLSDHGVTDEHGYFDTLYEQLQGDCWLIGSVNATPRVCKQVFDHRARLLAGLLALSAGATYERGAQAFRIGVITSPDEGRQSVSSHAAWASNRSLSFGRSWRRGQEYVITPDIVEQWKGSSVFTSLVSILERTDHTALEAAVVRAVFWYSDAHKDAADVMRFVKYWSCFEAFFSLGDNIVRSTTVGSAVILAFGPLGFMDRSAYVSTRQRLTRLYGKRSKAVHGAAHDHVLYTDLSDLSQWAAWLILSVATLTHRYRTPSELLRHCMAIDARHERSSAHSDSAKGNQPQ